MSARKKVRHAGIEWHCEPCIRYHSYRTPRNSDSPNANALVYGDSIALGAEKHPLTLESGLDREVGDSNEQPCRTRGSCRPSGGVGSDSKLSMLIPDAGCIPDDD